jgi:hypothetical protein
VTQFGKRPVSAYRDSYVNFYKEIYEHEFFNPRGKTGSIPWCKPIIRLEEKWRTEILFFPPFFYFSFASQNRPNASITLLTYEYGIGTQNAISYRSFRARIATFFWTDKEILFLGIDSYLCLVLNPVDKFGFEWCEGYFFLTIFSCEKNTSFAPSEPVSDMIIFYLAK